MSAGTDEVIRAEGLTKVYAGGRTAVDHLDLSVLRYTMAVRTNNSAVARAIAAIDADVWAGRRVSAKHLHDLDHVELPPCHPAFSLWWARRRLHVQRTRRTAPPGAEVALGNPDAGEVGNNSGIDNGS